MDCSVASSVPALLEHLETLTHAGRWTAMVQLGRRSVTPDEAAALQPVLVALASSEVHYERLLAAMAMRGAAAKQTSLPAPLADACRRLYFDASSDIYRAVQEPLILTSTDAALVEVLRACPMRQFRRLAAALQARGRASLLHAVYAEAVEKKGPAVPAERLALLTGYMPPEAVRALSEEAVVALTTDAIRSLTLQAPEAVTERLVTSVAAVRTSAEEEAAHRVAVLPRALENAVLTALDQLTDITFHTAAATACGLRLMEAAAHRVQTSDYRARSRLSAILGRLASRDPIRVAEYLLAHKSSFPNRLQRVFSRNTREVLERDPVLVTRIAEAGVIPGMQRGALTSRLGRLPVDTRRHVWRTLRDRFVDDDKTVSSALVTDLPDAEEREALAREMYAHPLFESQPASRLPYLSVLPFPEAKALAEPFITDPKPEVRQMTVRPLVNTACYHSEHLDAILSHLLARRKEADPYRLAAFEALADLHPCVWARQGDVAARVDKLAQLVEASMENKDVSASTLSSAQRVFFRVIALDPARVAPVLASAVRAFGVLNGARELKTATPATARLIADAVFPVMREQMTKRGLLSVVQTILNAFGDAHVRHMWATHFRPLVEECTAAPDYATATFGMTTWVKYERLPAVAQFVESLLEKEPDAILFPVTHPVVELVLQGKALESAMRPVPELNLSGRFYDKLASGVPVHYIQLNTSQYSRTWTARQQNLYAKTLTVALETVYADDFQKVRTLIGLVAVMPSVNFETALKPFAACEYPTARTRALVLSAMGKMKDKASLDELFAALNDDRVSEAAVSIQSRLRSWSSERVIDLLSPLLFSSKAVGVQKHLVRFIGSYADDAAFVCLQKFRTAKGGDMHADVRVALAAAFYPFLGREVVWDFYDEVAQSTREADVIALADIPEDSLRETWQQERMNALLLAMLTHSNKRVQSVAVEHLVEHPPRLEDARIYKVLLANLSVKDDHNIPRSSLSAIMAFRHEPLDVAVDVIAKLPSDRALSRAVDHITNAMDREQDGSDTGARVRSMVTLLMERLKAARRQPVLMVKLLVALPPSTWCANIVALNDMGLLHTGAQMTFLEEVGNRTWRQREALKELEATQLRDHPFVLLRRSGFSVLNANFRNMPRTEARHAFKRYREDPDPWVREAALISDYYDNAEGSSKDEESESSHDEESYGDQDEESGN